MKREHHRLAIMDRFMVPKSQLPKKKRRTGPVQVRIRDLRKVVRSGRLCLRGCQAVSHPPKQTDTRKVNRIKCFLQDSAVRGVALLVYLICM